MPKSTVRFVVTYFNNRMRMTNVGRVVATTTRQGKQGMEAGYRLYETREAAEAELKAARAEWALWQAMTS